MPARVFRPQWQIAAAYNLCGDFGSPLGDPPEPTEPDLLFSFVGGTTHRCRKAIFALSDRRAHIECTDGFRFYDKSSERYEERQRASYELSCDPSSSSARGERGPRPSACTNTGRRAGPGDHFRPVDAAAGPGLGEASPSAGPSHRCPTSPPGWPSWSHTLPKWERGPVVPTKTGSLPT